MVNKLRESAEVVTADSSFMVQKNERFIRVKNQRDRGAEYMRFLSGYIWQKGGCSGRSRDAVTLQQVRYRRRGVLMACVCGGQGELAQAETTAGYLTEQIIEWFYHSGIQMCGKDLGDKLIERALSRELGRIREELDRYGDKKKSKPCAAVTVILVCEDRFWLLHSGNNSSYLSNRRFQKAHLRRLAGDFMADTDRREAEGCPQPGLMTGPPWKEPLAVGGRLQKGLGVLIGTQGFFQGVTEEELRECLNVREIIRERQIEKRLEALARKGGEEAEGGAAVYFQTV